MARHAVPSPTAELPSATLSPTRWRAPDKSAVPLIRGFYENCHSQPGPYRSQGSPACAGLPDRVRPGDRAATRCPCGRRKRLGLFGRGTARRANHDQRASPAPGARASREAVLRPAARTGAPGAISRALRARNHHGARAPVNSDGKGRPIAKWRRAVRAFAPTGKRGPRIRAEYQSLKTARHTTREQEEHDIGGLRHGACPLKTHLHKPGISGSGPRHRPG